MRVPPEARGLTRKRLEIGSIRKGLVCCWSLAGTTEYRGRRTLSSERWRKAYTHCQREKHGIEQVIISWVLLDDGGQLQDGQSPCSCAHQVEKPHNDKVDEINRASCVYPGGDRIWVILRRICPEGEPENRLSVLSQQRSGPRLPQYVSCLHTNHTTLILPN